MSILDTFLILFESDADDVKKGADVAGKAQDDLEKKIKASDVAANKLGGSFIGMAKAAAASFAAIFSVATITRGILAEANYADALGESAEALGINIELLDTWGSAVKIAGGTAEGFVGTVKTLAASLAQVDTTGKSRALPFFKELGIQMLDVRGKARPVMELLPEIADAFSKMSREQSLGFGRKLGLDEGTIMLLQRGRREVEALVARQRELGVITKEDAEIASKFNDQLDDTKRVMGSVFRSLGVELLPVLGNFFEKIQKIVAWMRDNKELVKGFFMATSFVITAYLLPAMIRLAIATTAATWPFILIAAAVIALGVAFTVVREDILAFMAGNDSAIGRLLQKWRDFVSGFKIMMAELWAQVKDAFNAGVDSIIAAFQRMYEVVIGIWNKIKSEVFSVGALTPYGMMKQAYGIGQQVLSTANSTPLAGASANGIIGAGARNSSRQMNFNIDKIEVQTQATDADGIAGGISDGLNTQFRQTASQFDDGVAY